MKLKSYFAASVESALNTAHQELGPEAMLVDSRRTSVEARHLGEYEVVCAVFPPAPANAPLADAEEAPQPAFLQHLRAPGLEKLSQEVHDLKRSMERMAMTINRSSAGVSNLRANPELAEAYARLTTAEVDSALAHEIVSKLAPQLQVGSNAESMLAEALEEMLAVDPRLGRPGAARIITALVGPPGAGKTTTLVKLAAIYGLTTRKPTQIITMDTHRVAAAEQLRTYAAILGVGFQIVDTTTALAQALEEHRQKDLVLIDTPGFGAKDMEDAHDIARFLSTHPDIDVQLVLPASLRASDLKRVVETYEIFRPAKLLFTRMDETQTFGPILNLVVNTGKPVSFLCNGQQVPEDFGIAKKSLLADLILGQQYMQNALNSSVAAA